MWSKPSNAACPPKKTDHQCFRGCVFHCYSFDFLVKETCLIMINWSFPGSTKWCRTTLEIPVTSRTSLSPLLFLVKPLPFIQLYTVPLSLTTKKNVLGKFGKLLDIFLHLRSENLDPVDDRGSAGEGASSATLFLRMVRPVVYPANAFDSRLRGD